MQIEVNPEEATMLARLVDLWVGAGTDTHPDRAAVLSLQRKMLAPVAHVGTLGTEPDGTFVFVAEGESDEPVCDCDDEECGCSCHDEH